MNTAKKMTSVMRRNGVLLFVLLTMLLISFFSESALAGATRGVDLCLHHIVPSTFPFLVLAGILGRYTSGRKGGMASSVLVGNLSGYPVGGRLCAELSTNGALTGNEKVLMLISCIGAGPGFVISAVGTGILGSSGAGVLLFVSQLLTSFTAAGVLLLSRLMRRGNGGAAADVVADETRPSFSSAMVESTKSACVSMLHICGFVTLFSCLTGVIEGISGGFSGIGGMLFAGILEISGGCGRAELSFGAVGFSALGGLLGFGGLSVFCQLAAITAESGISLRQLFLSRVAAGALGALYSLILFVSFPSFISTAVFDAEVNSTALHPLPLTVALCILFGVLLCADRKTGELRLFGNKEKTSA